MLAFSQCDVDEINRSIQSAGCSSATQFNFFHDVEEQAIGKGKVPQVWKSGTCPKSQIARQRQL